MKKELMIIRINDFPIAKKVVIDSLMDIYTRDGALSTESVIKEATDNKHPLHPAFEWDNKIAAHKHRLWQARKLIASVLIKKESNGKVTEVRAFVNITRDENDNLSTNPLQRNRKSVFVSVDAVLQDSALQKYTLEIAVRDMREMMRRYENLAELMPLFKTIDKELKKFEMQILKHGIKETQAA